MVAKEELAEVCKALKMKGEIEQEISDDKNGNYLWKDLKEGRKITLSSLIEFQETEERVRAIQAALQVKLGEIEVIEQVQTYVRFKTGGNASVGALFEFLEGKKEQLHIQQYSVRQVTVEQIFNKFAEEDGLNMD